MRPPSNSLRPSTPDEMVQQAQPANESDSDAAAGCEAAKIYWLGTGAWVMTTPAVNGLILLDIASWSSAFISCHASLLRSNASRISVSVRACAFMRSSS